jgi:hypothetical protein
MVKMPVNRGNRTLLYLRVEKEFSFQPLGGFMSILTKLSVIVLISI